MKYIPVEKIYNLMVQVFCKLGVPKSEAKICADVLITSDLSGIESHGVGRLKMYYDRIKAGIQNVNTKIEVVKDEKATTVWDGNHGMGHVISHRAMNKAMDKAAEFGVGIVAVRNSTHYGICGYYCRQAAKKNMIGITFTNARPSIAPLFGTSPMLGTNPIAFGCPTNLPYSFIYDAATSITQRGKIEVLGREGKSTPKEWAIDSGGKPYTDTQKLLVDLIAKKAALVGLGGTEEVSGGHKGFGLVVMVEILCAALQNGSYLHGLHGWDGDKRVPYKLGHFFLAIDIEKFIEIKRFKEITTDILKQIQNSKIRKDKTKIFVAGEKEYLKEQEVRERGIPINYELEKNLEMMIKDLKIEFGFPSS
ncbi:MAG: Ldh family oxidoreductase [Candidatus Cloacimonetes bacterium]|nr:Ldh family oxidoreductase [Candidatus Cloacimonadota bacterium]MCF7815402.1 Ldh family oxidoreductase [Candidatus Cloacimonadota bacterium]MCF7869482.1 Ldh family oxidoreductase [Candidatus Cloacimonadota bacterium]MCF7884843.1 Ldh family oxidoreductase [Candidatus Cloacimonadota bacterium]